LPGLWSGFDAPTHTHFAPFFPAIFLFRLRFPLSVPLPQPDPLCIQKKSAAETRRPNLTLFMKHSPDGDFLFRDRNYSGQEEILATNFTNGANFLRVIREIRAIRGKG